MARTKEIPDSAARKIAKEFRYDQVVILGRKTGDGGMEAVATYGVDAAHSEVAEAMGRFLKDKIMGWEEKPE